MKITCNWLREYVDYDWDWPELVERLTMSGLEMESVDDLGERLRGVVVGHVVAVESHPNADRLSLCRVDLGDGEHTIVCGAPNVAAGQYVPVARPGASLPGGMEIRRAKIRGVESAGMICSETELGLGDDASGIMVLDGPCEPGVALAGALGLDDVAVDFEVTPNRPDCLSLFGIAREVKALNGAALRPPEAGLAEAGEPAAAAAALDIEDPEGCPRYCARLIRGVRIGPSPTWLRQRLLAVGQRPINNVVDVTNFVMLELGHPLHAFDLALLTDHRIVVRRARAGEQLQTLDGVEHELSDEVLVIADAERPVALAGIMGGANSEVTESTVDILLESACFSPSRVRRGAALMQSQTEASSRFERGADWEMAPRACDRAAALIAELAGGQVAPGLLDAYPLPQSAPEVEMRPARAAALLGAPELDAAECRRILELLGCTVREDGPVLSAQVPTFRPDLDREADLIEEVGRIYGYDRIASSDRLAGPVSAGHTPAYTAAGEARARLRALGVDEVVTSTIVERRWVEQFGDSELTAWELANPSTESQDRLRTGLVPSLLDVARRNFNQRAASVCIFELGKRFYTAADGPPVEEMALAGLWSGARTTSPWRREQADVDFLDLKGVAECLLEDVEPVFSPGEHQLLRPGHAATISVGGVAIGFIGELCTAAREAFDLANPVYIFELAFAPVADAWRRLERGYQPLPKFPPIERDLAVVLADSVEAAAVAAGIRDVEPELIESVELFDLYTGDQLEAGQKSLAFSIRLRAGDKTLEDRQADEVMARVVAHLEKAFDARQR